MGSVQVLLSLALKAKTIQPPFHKCRVPLQSPPTKEKTQKKNLTSSNKQSSTKKTRQPKNLFILNKIHFQIIKTA
jgi:hypothetical protein